MKGAVDDRASVNVVFREQDLRPLGSPPPIVSKARTTHVAVHRRRIHHSVESATSDARAVWRPIEDVRPAYPRDRTKAISDDDRLTDFPLPDWHKEASSRRAHLGRAGLPLGPNFDAPKAVSGVMIRFDDLMTRCLVRALMAPSQSKRCPMGVVSGEQQEPLFEMTCIC